MNEKQTDMMESERSHVQSNKVIATIGDHTAAVTTPAFVINDEGAYIATRPVSRVEILEQAAEIRSQASHGIKMSSAKESAEWATSQIGHLEHERFIAIWLDTRQCVISWQTMSLGTVDGAAVYPREVVKAALAANASRVIVAHNHPSGDPNPSQADKNITNRLVEALGLVEIGLLDHLVVANDQYVSFSERGLM